MKENKSLVTVQEEQLIKLCRVQAELIDPFLNYTYRDRYLNQDTEDNIAEVYGGVPYYKPRGWMFYGFKQEHCLSLEEMRYTRNNWGVGYCSMDQVAMTSFEDDQDIGENFSLYAGSKCGNGIVIYSKIDGCAGNRAVDLTFGGERHKFYIKLKVRFDTQKARVPNTGKHAVYILNDPADVYTEGLLIKRVKDTDSPTNVLKRSIILI